MNAGRLLRTPENQASAQAATMKQQGGGKGRGQHQVLSSGSTSVEPGADGMILVVRRILSGFVQLQHLWRYRGSVAAGAAPSGYAGRGPMEGLSVHYWNFVPEYITHGCWQHCMVDAVKVLEPRVMMPNIAMHPMNEHLGTKTCRKHQSHASSN